MKITEPSTPPTNDEQQSSDPYERMCSEIYTYIFGKISFLELLDKLEEILGIQPPQTNDNTSDKGGDE